VVPLFETGIVTGLGGNSTLLPTASPVKMVT
jgi:hypothetical protein